MDLQIFALKGTFAMTSGRKGLAAFTCTVNVTIFRTVKKRVQSKPVELLTYNVNEMVSTGDTEISLHIRSPRFRAGGEYSGVRTENTHSAKICLSFNLGGRGVLWSQN